MIRGGTRARSQADAPGNWGVEYAGFQARALAHAHTRFRAVAHGRKPSRQRGRGQGEIQELVTYGSVGRSHCGFVGLVGFVLANRPARPGPLLHHQSGAGKT